MTVTDTLPAGVTLAANAICAANGTSSCGTVTGTTGQAAFGTTLARVNAGGGNTIVFTIPVAFGVEMTANPLVNTATASDVPTGATASGSDSDALSLDVTLAVTKTDGSATYTPGGTAIYTVTIANTGVSDALNVTVTDTLPPGVTLSGTVTCVANGGSLCGTVTGTTGQSAFGATFAHIDPGGADTLVFTVPVVFAAGMTTDPLVNTATATDVASGNTDSGSDSDALLAAVTLAVTKTDGSATYTPGGSATYTVTVANTGLSDALDVTVTDALPAGVTLSANATCVAGGSSSCGTVTGTTGQVAFGATLARVNAGAGNALVFTVPVAFASAMTTSPLINTATASDIASGVTANGSDTDTRAASVTLAVAKTDGSATYSPGGAATYTVTVSNTGFSDALNVTVTDPLPPGVTLAANATCVASGTSNCGTVTGTTGQTAIGATAARVNPGAGNALVFTVPVAFAAGMTSDPLVNTATATDVPTGSTANGSDSDTLASSVTLAVTKTDGSATYSPGGTATYTVTVSNTGLSDALNVTVTDLLPVGVTLTANATLSGERHLELRHRVRYHGATELRRLLRTRKYGRGQFARVHRAGRLRGGHGRRSDHQHRDGDRLLGRPGQLRKRHGHGLAHAAVTLAVTKTDGASTYTPGGTATYTVTVANTGPSDAQNVTVTDALPAGVTLAANATCAANGTSSCGTVTGTTGQTAFGTTLARVNAGGGNTIVFTIPVAFGVEMLTDPLVNTATATDVPTGATASGSDSDARSANVTLAVTKTDGSATYTPGGTAIYTVTVADTSLSDALDVTVTDPLPPGVTLAGNVTCVANGLSCCGTVTGTTGQNAFGATGAHLDPGGAHTLVFTVPVVFAAGMTTNPLVNTATATDLTTGVTANGSDSDALSAAVTLAVTKTDGASTYTPGGTATYTVTVANTGISDALDVTVTDALPPGLTLAANATCAANGTSSCGTVTGTTGQTGLGATLARVDAGGGNTIVFTIPVAFAAGMLTDPLVNTAQAIDVPTGATASGSDIDALSLDVTLSVTKTDGSATYTPGGTAIYTVTVADTGLSHAPNVTVTDSLPAGVTLGGNATCVANGTSLCGTVTGTTGQSAFGATLAHVDAGGANTLVFTVPVVFAAGMTTNPLVNTATASDITSGITASGSDSDALSAAVTLAVTKTDGASTYTPGGTATYTITVANTSLSDALDVTVTDALPPGVTLSANATCVASGTSSCGTLTGTMGQAAFGATAARVNAGAGNSLVFTIPVAFAAGMTTSPLINTATASDIATGVTANGSDSDTLSAAVALAVTKTDGSATYAPGGTASYTVSVSNNGTSDALNVTVTDPLPAGVTLSANATCVANGTSSCGTVTGTIGQTSFGTTGALVNAGAGNALVFTVPVAFAANMVADPIINTATATDLASAGPGSTASGTDTDARSATVALIVVKTDGSATYAPGGVATYTVTVTNAGPAVATNVTVTDALPAGLTLTANATCVAGGTANCGTVTGTTGQTSFGTTGAIVAVGAGNSLVFTVPVAFATGMTTDPLVNTATATDLGASGPGSSASGSDSDTRSASVTLAVAKTDGASTYTPGGTATYAVTVANTGLSDALDVTVTDALPAGLTLAANATCVANGTSNCGTITGTTGQTAFGTTLARVNAGGGNTIVFTIPVTFAAGMSTNPLINSATATDAPTGATATGSDSDTLSANVTLAVAKTDGSATYTPGGTATYTVTVANTGVSDALNVTVSDPLPAGVTLGANATCVANGTSSCGTVTGATGQGSFGTTAARINAGGANTLVFTAPVVFASGMTVDPLVNTATATDLASGNTANGSDSDTLSAAVTLGVTKTDGSATYAPGGVATYTVTVANTGLSDAVNVTVTDPLPPGVTLSANATCVASGTSICGTVTGTTGQATFGATAARVNAGAGNALVFTVPVAFASGMTTNPLINTATASDISSGVTANGSDSDVLASSVTLAVTKTDGSATYTPGGTATYTVTVSNTGQSDALNVTLTDPLPAGVTLTANATCVANGTSSCGTVTGTTGQTAFGASLARVNAGAGNTLSIAAPVAFAAGMTTTPLINTATATDVPTGATANGSDSDALLSNVTLTVTKTDGSATYTPGGAATYTVTITNTGVSDALNVTVTDPLPAGVTLTANATCVANGTSSCGTVTGTTGQASFGATFARVNTGAGNAISFNVPVAFAAGMTTNPLVNIATATDQASGASANGSDSDALVAASGLAVTKTDGSATYTPGGTATYTIVVTNAGPSNAGSITVTDNLPAGVTLSAAATCVATGAATCGTVTGATGATAFGATAATIAAGAGNRLTFTVPVNFAAGLATDPLVNTVNVTDPASAPAAASDSDSRIPQADVGIQKTGPAQVSVGSAITYTLTITNAGPSAANGATFNDPVPGAITGISAACGSAAGGAACGAVSVVGNNVSGTVPVLPVGGSVVITIHGTVTGFGLITNTATVAPPLGLVDPVPSNSSSSASTSVNGAAATQIPANAPWALALLLLALATLGMRSARNRQRPTRR